MEQELAAASTKLKKIEPIFNELNGNYEDLAKVGDNNFYGCYKTLFNDEKDQFN